MTSGDNSFNDYPENKLAIDFAFLCKPNWWNATVSPFSLVLISFGDQRSPQKIVGGMVGGNGVPPLTTPLHMP